MSYRKLSREEKQRLVRCFECGLSAPRISQLMDIPVATIKRWREKWQEGRIPRMRETPVSPPVLTVRFPPPPLAPSQIAPIPLSRLMAGR